VGQENFSRLISEVKKRDLFAIRKLYFADFAALRKNSNSRFAISRHGGRRDSGAVAPADFVSHQEIGKRIQQAATAATKDAFCND